MTNNAASAAKSTKGTKTRSGRRAAGGSASRRGSVAVIYSKLSGSESWGVPRDNDESACFKRM